MEIIKNITIGNQRKILLLTPPMTQLNTPYPATCYLMGFLKDRGIVAYQDDPAIELIHRLFSREKLRQLYCKVLEKKHVSESLQFFVDAIDDYSCTVEPLKKFLTGQDPSLAHRIAARLFLPEGPCFSPVREQTHSHAFRKAFGDLGVQDRAKYLASLYLNDLTLYYQQADDDGFNLSRYSEKLAQSSASFDAIHEKLSQTQETIIEKTLFEITSELVDHHKPDVVCLTVPFPGNVFGAFFMAKTIKQILPETKIIMGGGYVNTELRKLDDVRVFDFVDYVSLDDGEQPLLSILKRLDDPGAPLLRTFFKKNNAVVFESSTTVHDIPFRQTGCPSYAGLPLKKYFSILEMLNPMHRIWSDARWNKLTLAHGCYWKKCNFCDISLDYIGRYEPSTAELIVEKIERIIAETGTSGFHFVDEAAPPKLLKEMAEILIRKKIQISWWGNIRFDPYFTKQCADLLASSGCIALSGGLEVASDRLLTFMQKGVSVEQVAKVTKNLTDAGILVHAYLMYGFPTQTVQETIDSLERVRQLFNEGCLTSAFWHRFSATAHSPIGKDPERFGIKIERKKNILFAENDLEFFDPTGTPHDELGDGLKKALYNFMHGVALKEDVRAWFEFKVPKPQVHPRLVSNALRELSS